MMIRVATCSIALILFCLPAVFAQVPAAKSAAPSNLLQAPAAAANSGNPAHRLEGVALACLLLSLIAIHWNVIGNAHRY